jgi:hypothetical protein
LRDDWVAPVISFVLDSDYSVLDSYFGHYKFDGCPMLGSFSVRDGYFAPDTDYVCDSDYSASDTDLGYYKLFGCPMLGSFPLRDDRVAPVIYFVLDTDYSAFDTDFGYYKLFDCPMLGSFSMFDGYFVSDTEYPVLDFHSMLVLQHQACEADDDIYYDLFECYFGDAGTLQAAGLAHQDRRHRDGDPSVQ